MRKNHHILALLSVWVVLAVSVILFGWTAERVGLWKAALIVVLYLVGTISAEAKDAISQSTRTGKLRQDMMDALRLALANERGAKFVYHSAQWAALTIAATLLAGAVAS